MNLDFFLDEVLGGMRGVCRFWRRRLVGISKSVEVKDMALWLFDVLFSASGDGPTLVDPRPWEPCGRFRLVREGSDTL